MASGGGYYQGYGRGGGRFGGGYGSYGGYPSRGQDYSRDPSSSYGDTRMNPEYFHKERGYGYEGTRSSAIDPFENPMAKRRKIENVTICVDYVRGYCVKGSRCPKPHVDYVESIDEREIMAKLKFCHDFQNKGMCTRRDCKFLHVTRREEDEFLLTGTIPQAVFSRMREWTREHNPDFREYEGGGGGGGGGKPMSSSHNPGSRGFGGGRGGMGSRGSAPHGRSYHGGGGHPGNASAGYVSGTGHSMSQPVTYDNYCIDFLKGTCAKNQSCPLKHTECVDDPNDRQGVIKQVFCHDYQNQSCKRPFCKFIHATRAEEEFFMENGYFPPALNSRNRDKMFFSDICIDYLRNQCIRGNQCQYTHVDKVEAHNERICLSRSIFCHDYQENGCSRPNCKLVHTGKPDEQYFLRTGTLPDYLRVDSGSSSGNGNLSSSNVCREFVKNQCNRGTSCRFYHPTPAELQGLLSQQKPVETPEESSAGGNDEPLSRENEELKGRVQQLERLLADACHCITLAVGDQNPAIAALMKTIATMAPASSLANQTETQGDSSEDQSEGVKEAVPGGTPIPTVNS